MDFGAYRNNQGRIAEILFDAECLDRNYRVFAAVSPGEEWDRVVNRHNVDIKMSSNSRHCEIGLNRAAELDFFAVFLAPSFLWYILPARDFPRKRFYYGEQWLGRWDLLR